MRYQETGQYIVLVLFVVRRDVPINGIVFMLMLYTSKNLCKSQRQHPLEHSFINLVDFLWIGTVLAQTLLKCLPGKQGDIPV